MGSGALYRRAAVAYAAVAVLFSWPLPLHLGTAITGPVSGDTGVYIWNLWVFRHQIAAHRANPLFTSEILAPGPPVDLSLHNYTLFPDALAFPLIPVLGTVATFNVVYLFFMTALTAGAMFLLARRAGAAPIEAWLAGLLFAWSPVLVARSTAHFSLVAAAPLPIFMLALLRAIRTQRVSHAALAGLAVAWAVTCDVYYGVYCLLLGACVLTAQAAEVSWRPSEATARRVILRRGLDAAIVLVAVAIVVVALSGGSRIELGGLTLSMHSMYTPVLLLTILVACRIALRLSWRIANTEGLH
ncbi:MAG: hypothetical protein LC804_27030, partial [Acidobacteria bacterium]|nr:hypothetical protein [Acidobacteriota bacterium]